MILFPIQPIVSQPSPAVPESANSTQLAAIILCGGHSSRMGFDKFRLPLKGRTFLECVVDKLATVVDGPIIAAASERTAPEVIKIGKSIDLDRFGIVVDQRDDSGPMEGILSLIHI